MSDNDRRDYCATLLVDVHFLENNDIAYIMVNMKHYTEQPVKSNAFTKNCNPR